MFYEAISKPALGILEKLGNNNFVSENFYLAGGTGLSLQIGHRLSVDLDFFTRNDLNIEEINSIMFKLNSDKIYEAKNTIWYNVENVTISFIKYDYPVLGIGAEISNVKIASIEDIICMKIIALAQRGMKKDFYDVYEAFQLFKPIELKEILLKKYGEKVINYYQVMLSLTYFDDAEQNPDVVSLKQINWTKIKNYFNENINNIRKAFLEN